MSWPIYMQIPSLHQQNFFALLTHIIELNPAQSQYRKCSLLIWMVIKKQKKVLFIAACMFSMQLANHKKMHIYSLKKIQELQMKNIVKLTVNVNIKSHSILKAEAKKNKTKKRGGKKTNSCKKSEISHNLSFSAKYITLRFEVTTL